VIKNRMLQSFVVLFLFLPIAFLGCSGGGDDAPAPVPTPSIQVLPSSYDFGVVTPGNSPAPLEVEIANNGSVGFTVSGIVLSDIINFNLDLSGGSNPCKTLPLAIAAGGNCTLEVIFDPKSDDIFDESLTITSNASNTPTFNLSLAGKSEPIDKLNVRINQIDACPRPTVTAYVNVTDQAGYPVVTLKETDFSVTDDATGPVQPTAVNFVSNTAPISVALVMDYSGSITEIQDAVDDMEDAVASFVNQLGDNDEAEIVKFASTVKVVDPPGFTSDKALLTAAIETTLDVGVYTALYDAVVKGVDDTAARNKIRRAVIVITDGVDSDGSGNPISKNDLNDAINYANNNGVPIFTVGLGQADDAILQQMANDTGGSFFEATTSDNLRTIYQQLADILFQDSYILTYNSNLAAGLTGNLTVEATYSPTIKGEDTNGIAACQ